ncbi:MAG: 2-oxoglutarate dehydrogenase E1 component, partial [Bacteroidetes bacterium]|nr:2-oxoglutarate dehydrogenase E1 component [Bacteroidota bacterium]
MDKYSYISNAELASIEDLYQMYLKEDNAVDEGWRKFFEGFEFARKDFEANGEIPEAVSKEFKVLNLIDQYRTRGHLFTRTNPVRERRKYVPTLALENFGLSEADLDTVFQAASEVSLEPCTLKKIIESLEITYCESIGVEYMYIRSPERLAWLKKRLDKNNNTPNFSDKLRRYIFTKLNHAVVFESFLHSKYVGQKRFSLEGAESLIPAISAAIETGANLGIEQYVIGMAHRGRLNVLANILNKTYQDIFTEFENKEYGDSLFDGDVKYHQGY